MSALTKRQRTALALIRDTPHGVYLAYLAHQLGVSRRNATLTTTSLVRRGLVVRVPDSRGRVRYFLNHQFPLTPAEHPARATTTVRSELV